MTSVNWSHKKKLMYFLHAIYMCWKIIFTVNVVFTKPNFFPVNNLFFKDWSSLETDRNVHVNKPISTCDINRYVHNYCQSGYVNTGSNWLNVHKFFRGNCLLYP